MLALLLLLIGTKGAWAQTANCTGGGQSYTLQMPNAIAVAPNAPNGALTGWIESPAVSNWYNCVTAGQPATGTGFKVVGLTETGSTFSPAGGVANSTVFATGVGGIGFVINRQTYANGCGWEGYSNLPLLSPAQSLPGWGGTAGCNADGSWTDGGSVRIMLVKYAQVPNAGTTNGAGGVEATCIYGSALLVYPYTICPNTSFVTFAITPTDITLIRCTVADIPPVVLGTHNASEFSGQGTGTSASTSFNITLQECPSNASVAYQIDPAPSISYAIAPQSVVNLTGGTGQATGVGVQLLNSDGTVATMGSPKPVGSTIATNYTLSFKARYFQTGSTIMAGTGDTAMTITLSYP